MKVGKKKVGIIGLGVVGNAIYKHFKTKMDDVIGYDKFKRENSVEKIEDTSDCKIIFLCLPTLYDGEAKEYNKSALNEVCSFLQNIEYQGVTVLKSTIEPGVSNHLAQKYSLKIIHNPEFLSAKTAEVDFAEQHHIVLGKSQSCSDADIEYLKEFYKTTHPTAQVSIVTSTESEVMKLAVNNFYAVKIQFFNEIYLLSKKLGISYESVKKTMLKNGWINRMHTEVPGHDGKLSYGGMCFPKDTNALNEFMKKHGTYNALINSTVKERETIRDINY